MKKILFLLIAMLTMSLSPMEAQNKNTFSTAGWWKPSGPKFSPVVNADKTITFRIKAPKAKKVSLLFDEWDVTPQTMKKDKDGIWNVTIGPVEPRLYQYAFQVDGLKVIDLVNPVVKAGTEVYGSVVEVDGDTPRFDEQRNIAHGEVHILKYMSTPMQKMRQMYIYVPAAYSKQPGKSFPVLYLRHGGGDSESSWIRDGRADVIMDNLIADRKATPMIIVMANGLTDGSWSGGSTVEGMKILEDELLIDVMPYVENHYRILKGKENRAIAGLSMGGGQAFVLGMRNMDKFSYIGDFSAGILSEDNFDLDKYVPGFTADPTKANEQLRLLWISCGTKDPRYQGHLNFADRLNKWGVRNEFHHEEAGHEWKFWRSQLNEFAQQLFKDQAKEVLTMVDSNATPQTKALYANLWQIQKNGVMFGHHDYPSYGIGWRGDVDRSDVKDLTGSHPAVYSLDMNGINPQKIELIKAAYKRGGISMLVWHQNNPLTEGPGKKYPEGTAWDNTKVVDQILKDGSEMNIKYKKRLDGVAEAFHSMVDENGQSIPVIFRPLHEHTQKWNWWGSASTSDQEFVAFWRFIVTYLRDVKNVHNVIYAISPQMDDVYADAKARLMYRWPGNDYVDLLGMDCYHGRKREAFVSNLKGLTEMSDILQKPVGVTETGLENDHTANYWTRDVLAPLRNNVASMVVAWRNDNPRHAFGPYPTDVSADDFKTFYNDPQTIFEKDLPNMYVMPSNITVK